MTHYMRTICILGLIIATLLGAAAGATYNVGPGQDYASIGAVPWESIGAGDVVQIHWREAAYHEKWVICRQGTEQAPITVRGILGPGGQRPVIDGQDATTRAALNYWNEDRGVIKIGGANTPPDTMPRWIVIENLDIRSARPPYSFTGRNGLTNYIGNASAIYVEKCENLIVRNCVMRDCGNGFFTANQSTNVLVEQCHIYDNGIEGSIYEHNNYTEANGITFQFNRFGPLRAGCPGNNLKDRSAGCVIRYNWIEGGNRQLDLVESSSSALNTQPQYRETFVYGNILIEPDGAGNSQIAHYGGDNSNQSYYRKGTLFFHNNTVISTRTGNTTLVRLSTISESADVRNNIVYVTAEGNRLAMCAETGVMNLRNNWMKSGWVNSHEGGGFAGTVTNHGGGVAGSEPGFADFAAQDFHLADDSNCCNAGAALDAAALPDHAAIMEYLKHQAGAARQDVGLPDLGAYACESTAVQDALFIIK